MRILTINVLGIPSGNSSNLIQANIFQDYSAVIVDPDSFEDLYAPIRNRLYDRFNISSLNSESGEIITRVNEKRREEVNSLLQSGGVVVCFLEPIIKKGYEFNYEGEEYWYFVTNYDWLLEPQDMKNELVEIKCSKSDTIDYIDSGHPFSEYLNIRPSWSAYVDKDACENWKIIASAFGTHAVSLVKKVGLGQIILLPNHFIYDNGELLESCITKLLEDKDTTPQPSWAQFIIVPGQEELISKIKQIDKKTSTLEKEREVIIEKNKELENWKKLLYSQGKHELEPLVRKAFTLIGCNIEPQPDKASDGSVICEYGTALLEIVGSIGTIKIEKLGQLTRNMSSYFETGKGKVKGILVGNPFCKKQIDNRPPKDTQKQLFSKELIESSDELSISVLLSSDLYEIVCNIITGKLTAEDKISLQKKIFKSKGLVRLV